MDAIDDGVKERYDNFVERLYQYVTTPIKDFAAIKPQILEILKTHRPIKKGDYQYGISKTGKKNCQLIVQECNQRSMVREYFKDGKHVWHCCECVRTGDVSQESKDLIIAHGIVFVKLQHECTPRQLSFVLEIQKLYKDGKKDEAAALQKSTLGFEDLNVVSTKNVAGKRGTKAFIEQTKIKDSDSILQYTAEENNESVQELQPSMIEEFLDENGERLSPEALFAKIIENLQEYTNVAGEEVISNKSKLIHALKTHYPVKRGYYQYGLSGALKGNERLIVFEWNDRIRVREYCKKMERNYPRWECRECHRLRDNQKNLINRHYLRLINSIAFVPFDHGCLPRDYRLVMQYQKFLENGDTTKANRMSKTKGFLFGQDLTNINLIDDAASALFTKELAQESNGTTNSSEPLSNLKRKIHSYDEDDSLNDKSPVHKKSKLNKLTLDSTSFAENDPIYPVEELPLRKRSKHKNIISDVLMDDTNTNEVSESVDDKQQKKLKSKKNKGNQSDGEAETISEMKLKVPSVTSSSRFTFEKPPPSMLEEICGKFNLQYRSKAMKIWDRIMFKQIDTESFPNIETHEFQTENFYEILSKLFTGKFKHHVQIKETILDAFRTKVVDSCEMSTKKFNKHFWKDTVTDRHLSFIAKFLSCRILIYDFDEGEIRRYGKWKESSRKRLTVVLSFSDGLYSIVLNL